MNCENSRIPQLVENIIHNKFHIPKPKILKRENHFSYFSIQAIHLWTSKIANNNETV